MRFSTVLFALSLCFPLSASAQGVIINEIYNSSGSDEWVELLVVADGSDLRGWDLRDYSSGGAAQAPLSFTTAALWQNLAKGTLIVVARPETGLPEDLDPGDFQMVVHTDNALLFSGNPFSFAGTSDAMEIRNAIDVRVTAVSWGGNNVLGLHFPGTMTSGRGIAFLGDSLVQLADISRWAFNSSTTSQGTGNSAANIAWLAALRSSPDGSGTARVLPDTLAGSVARDLMIVYRPDTAFSVTDLRVIMPSNFTWSRSGADVTITQMTSTVRVSGDTIECQAVSFSADSAVVTIANVIPPDSTAFYALSVQSRALSQFKNVAPLPRITVFGLPVTVSVVKGNDGNGVPSRLGQLVTLRGIVTVANEFGGPSFIQDPTGGIAVFGSQFSQSVVAGDEVIVSGVLDQFNGLTELAVPLLHQKPTSGNTVLPLMVNCAQLSTDGTGGVEEYEGLLVRVSGAILRDASGNALSSWAVTGSGSNYRLLDATDTVDIRVDNNVDFANTTAPQSAFDVIGVVSQFRSALPLIGGIQLMPRSRGDILASGPLIASTPVESHITPTSVHIKWTTVSQGSSRLRFGLTRSLELGQVVPDDSMRTAHDVLVSGLAPATVYSMQAYSAAGGDTSYAPVIVVSTASPAAATGAVNVYFNKSINSTVAWQQPANGNQDLVARVLVRINATQRSIDAALYSLSGTPGPGTDIANALIAAKNRGVHVRVVCEADNRSTAPLNALASNGIPLITDTFDPINAGAGLMHNKFFLFDARGGAPESVWVWTGSWNPTDPGTNADYQNAIEIQDPALAGAYLLEFNEMWGDAGDTPNAGLSRFGSRKSDNTPHRFVIGGREVESYFSPTDRTTAHIIAEIERAQHSVAFCLLTLTRTDIRTALTGKRGLGLSVRGALDNNTDTGTQYAFLLSGGVDVKLKSGTSGLLHHKYALIDAEDPAWSPVTLTGSHNWSNSAETTNNENLLIIRDHAVTNQYLQEFAARYYQFGGSDTIRVGVDIGDPSIPATYAVAQNFPNPFNPETLIRYQVPGEAQVTLAVYDVLGREVRILVNERESAGTYLLRFNATGLASGVYLYRLTAGGFSQTRRMVLLR